VIRLAVRVAAKQAEIVLAELLELAPGGVEELEIAPDTIEYAVYGAPGELPSLPDLRAVAGEALVEISTKQVAEDWHERWKQFHRPILVSPPGDCLQTLPALHVRPPWEAPSEPRDAPVREIVIDPGQAFGTGAHATTRLCLELLLELAATIPSAPAHMIISGLLCEEADQVAAAFVQRLGMHERLRRSSGEWAAVWLAAAGGSTSPD
jgi:ribosomal protein L11 methyltransferase